MLEESKVRFDREHLPSSFLEARTRRDELEKTVDIYYQNFPKPFIPDSMELSFLEDWIGEQLRLRLSQHGSWSIDSHTLKGLEALLARLSPDASFSPEEQGHLDVFAAYLERHHRR